MKILVTGAAGFIGFHLIERLSKEGHEVVGIDNINNYYDVNLKYARLAVSGIEKAQIDQAMTQRSLNGGVIEKLMVQSATYLNYRFAKIDLIDLPTLEAVFKIENFTHVVHLAAQAGVRYSIKNPHAYVQSNVVGFVNILECCRNYKIAHLLYASSSSVYGSNSKIPFSEEDSVDHPVSLYAATKKSNELMAHSYSHLYKFTTTGLRFFTVYGPWGRPDMAMFLFTNAIKNDKPLKVFNHGRMERDFTYIDDIVEGVKCIVDKPIKERIEKNELYKIYNIGNNNSLKLSDFIKEIESNLGKKAKKNLMEMQPGDVERTWANVDLLMKDYNYNPKTSIKEGVRSFVEWFQLFYNK